MGNSKTVAQLAKKLEKVQQVPAVASKAAVKATAQIAKANAENAVRAATNGSGRLRNTGANVRGLKGPRVVGKAGSNLTVSAKLENNGEQAFVKAVGAWQLIEGDTQAHEIGPAGQAKTVLFGPTVSGKVLKSKSGRAGAKAREGRAKALRTPYGLKRRVFQKGTKGKHPWAKAKQKTIAEVPATLQKVTHDELVKALS